MNLKDINFGPSGTARTITVDEWRDADGNPVKVLVKPISLEGQIEIEQHSKDISEATCQIAARCFLDPDTGEPMGTAEEWRQIPVTAGFRNLISQLNQATTLEQARKNSNGARPYKRRSRSGSVSTKQ